MTRILLVKTSSLGDVIHTAPAITEARRARPDLEIDWVVEESFGDIARLHPGVHAVRDVATRRWRRHPFAAATWSEIKGLRRVIEAAGYDAVIDAQGLLKSVFIARLAAAPIHGFDRKSAREPAAVLGYHHRHHVARDRHAIARTRLLFAGALGYEAAAAAPEFGLRAPPVPELLRGRDNLVLLLHGTTWSSKRWPARYWAELAQQLVAKGFLPVLPWSDGEERDLAQAVSAAAPPALVFPKARLVEIAGLLAASRLVVGVDTGLMHLAAAFSVPTISLFASTSPDLTGPLGPSSTVVAATIACAPCRRRECPLVPRGVDPPCHATIPPARVLAEIARRGLLDVGVRAAQ